MDLIFDSNIFDKLIKNELYSELTKNSSIKIFITHIQKDELNNIRNLEYKKILLDKLIEVNPMQIPTETIVIGTWRVGEGKISDGKMYSQLLGNNKKGNAINDSLIGEVAIKNNLTLITNDERFIKKYEKLSSNYLRFEDLITKIKNQEKVS